MADHNSQADAGERYAKALFDLAADIGGIASIEADLIALKQMLAESGDLRRLIGSPIFKSEQKGAVLQALAEKAGFQATTRKFLGLLSQNQRSGALPAVIAAYQRDGIYVPPAAAKAAE